MRRAALGALLLLAAHAAPAQEPQPGVDHDSWREVKLRPVAARDCLEIASSGQTLRFALADLRAMVVDAGAVIGPSEARLQRIFEMRAQGLLGRISAWPQEHECVRAQELAPDDRYVVAELLKSGRASVGAAPAIWVRHLGRRSSGRGDVLFYVKRADEPFFTVDWWRA